MSEPLVSVIVPCYNGDAYLNEAIQSALDQTWAHLEVIVVDDGSDRPVETVLTAADSRVHVHRTGNRGVAAARNYGIARARGEYIALLDQDDVWLPHKLERQLRVLREHPDVGLVHADVTTRDEIRGQVYQTSRPRAEFTGDCYARLFAGSSIAACTIVMRATSLRAVGLFDESIRGTDDYDLALRIARRYPFAYIDEPLAVYRVHESNWSRRDADMLCNLLRVIDKTIQEDPDLAGRVGQSAVDARRRDLSTLTGYALFDAGRYGEARPVLARRLRQSMAAAPAVWFLATFLPRGLVESLRRIQRVAVAES